MGIHRSVGVVKIQRRLGLTLMELRQYGFAKIYMRRSTWGEEYWVLTKRGVRYLRRKRR